MGESRPEPQIRPPLADVLAFRPRWWWDPVPEWVIQHLDRAVILRLALTQLEFEQTVLESQAKANSRVMEIVRESIR
jgi:hypothetical protein